MIQRISIVLIVLLVLCFAGGASAEENEVVLKMLNEVTDKYMSNQVDAAKSTAGKLKRYLDTRTEPDEFMLVVTEYVSGADADLNKLSAQIPNRPDATAVAFAAMFARNVALCELDRKVLGNNLELLEDGLSKASSSYAMVWKSKLGQWKSWCAGNFRSQAAADELLKAKSVSDEKAADLDKVTPPGELEKSSVPETKSGEIKSIRDLTGQDLKKIREGRYTKRYQPPAYDFEDNPKVQSYLDSITDAGMKARESERVRYVTMVKNHIISTLERNPYKGQVKLKRGSARGTVAMANDKSIIVRTKSGRGGKGYKWSEIAPQQIALFMEYYGDKRKKVVGAVSEEKKKKEAAKEFLAASILCDWYGLYDDSVRLMKKALDTNPEIESRITPFFME